MLGLMRAAAGVRPHEAVGRILMLDGLLHRTFMRLLGAQASNSTPWSATAMIERLSIPALRRLVSHVVDLVQSRQAVDADVQRWRAQLHSAVLAELLGEQLQMPFPMEARFYVLAGLAVADAGSEASTLVRYRHYPIADLIDAPLLLRLAVTALTAPAQRASYASELLGLGEATVVSIENIAATQLAARLQSSALPVDWDDTQEQSARDELNDLQAWMRRAQLWRDTLSFAPVNTDPTPYLERAFGARVLLLAESADGQALVARNHPDIRITQTNLRSQIARCAANGAPARIALWETTAHIDHAIFAALQSEELLLVTVVGQQGRRVLLSSPLARLGADASRIALAFAIGEWVEYDDRVFEANENLRRQMELVAAASDYEVRELIHETGNPLAVIANYLHLLRNAPVATNAVTNDGQTTYTDIHADDSAERQRNEYLQVVEDELARATTLLQTRSFALAQRTRSPPSFSAAVAPEHAPSSATVGALLGDVFLALQPLAERKAVQLVLQEAPRPGATVASAEHVRQILINLARNSIEAVAPSTGVVRLGVGEGRFRDGRANRVFEVADNGPGLSDEQCIHLADAKSSTKGGAGMGLAIAHRLAREQLGGSLDYESSAAGARFTLWVPLAGI